ncbi:hypothetical protein [Corynebacterium argentoratense]|uniref:hypothetical protein n=1 Tax=Corynebacterium argentoratense TaxID=42817 RepID=UPI001F400E26|nr:hypothetical protein [Corynebacterium argentoratense]MCF1712848.1 hypothetical protein [Corynebacterium argentoratense]
MHCIDLLGEKVDYVYSKEIGDRIEILDRPSSLAIDLATNAWTCDAKCFAESFLGYAVQEK